MEEVSQSVKMKHLDLVDQCVQLVVNRISRQADTSDTIPSFREEDVPGGPNKVAPLTPDTQPVKNLQKEEIFRPEPDQREPVEPINL